MFDSLHSYALSADLVADLVDLVTPPVHRLTVALSRSSATAKIACGEGEGPPALGELANGPQVLSPCARHELANRIPA
ncbi:unnamed protein product [Nippostrongylus brasiliensis]|uniref:Transcriptional regulator n=1 Tax=Nippostrongylus brasiliensis TaxID=27835 RepID=A0A0N4Y9I5_NIPBR|nr:unnamed protein product [Nippostrongylus brasiliensis]